MFKNLLLAILVLVLVILSCTKFGSKHSWDVTQNNANTLSKSSQQLLDNVDDTMKVYIYSPTMEVLTHFEATVDLYKKHSKKVKFYMQQTILDQIRAAKLKVITEHVILVEYKDKQYAVDIKHDKITEPQISAIMQQAFNSNNNWIAFITGHQEADPLASDDMGLSQFAQLFTKQGMNIAVVNLAEQKFIPQNTALVIVANPQQDFLPFEKAILHQYVANGGKLVWFTEPNAPITAFIAEEFGIKPAKGVAIDPESLKLGSPHPALKIITSYPEHAITKGLQSSTILPWSGHLQILYEANDWKQQPFLTTGAGTWTYVGPTTKDLDHLNQFKEFTGPLNIGIALSRQVATSKQEQHAVVIADSSFMINKYLSLYANAQLAGNVVTWAQNTTELFIYNPPPLKDLSYHPSKFDRIMFQYVFTLLIPCILIGIGFYQNRNWPKLK